MLSNEEFVHTRTIDKASIKAGLNDDTIVASKKPHLRLKVMMSSSTAWIRRRNRRQRRRERFSTAALAAGRAVFGAGAAYGSTARCAADRFQDRTGRVAGRGS